MDATPALIRTLAAVCRAGSMAAGARALRVDKATVSRRLAALERARPGLFERRGGRLEPTSAGSRALDALAEIERGEARLADELSATDTGAGSVRLTSPAFFAERVIVPELAGFLRAHPGLDVTVLATSRMLDLAAGQADVAVRNVPATSGALVSRKLGRMALGLYASRGYLAAHGRLRAPRELDGHDFVDYDFGTLSTPGLEWLPAAVRRARVVFRGDDASLVAHATACGLGIAALPCVVGDATTGLVRIDDSSSVFPFYAVVRAEVRRLARVRAVTAWLERVVADARVRLVPAAVDS
jgi:DNA-binding transcriptional LysR family regulator